MPAGGQCNATDSSLNLSDCISLGSRRQGASIQQIYVFTYSNGVYTAIVLITILCSLMMTSSDPAEAKARCWCTGAGLLSYISLGLLGLAARRRVRLILGIQKIGRNS
jgi:hypothetical protein